MPLTFNTNLSNSQTGAHANTMTGDLYNFTVAGKNDISNGKELNLWNVSNPINVTNRMDQNNWEITNFISCGEISYSHGCLSLWI